MENTNPTIKAIVFDLGGIIIDVDFGKTFAEYSKQTGLSVDSIKKAKRLAPVHQAYESGHLSDNQFRSEISNYFGVSLEPKSFNLAWNALLLDLNPKAIELIKKLRQEFSVYLLSNTNRIHFEECDRRLKHEFNETFESLFTGLFLSYKIGYRKPSELIYRHVVNQIGCQPHEILFIDDLEENTQAADRVGFKTIHLTNNRQIIHKVLKHIPLYGLKTR